MAQLNILIVPKTQHNGIANNCFFELVTKFIKLLFVEFLSEDDEIIINISDAFVGAHLQTNRKYY